MKYLVGGFLFLAIFSATTANKLGIIDRYFERCKDGSELVDPPQCPEVDPDLPVYHPFPYDCEQYYECSNGLARCIKCAPGTVWDQQNLICNHRDAVSCNVVTTPGPVDPTSEAAPPVKDEPPENVICEKEVTGVFAYPDNCSMFILCDPGRLPCIIKCPEGTCYNNETNICEYPSDADIMESGVDQRKDKANHYVLQGKFHNYKNINRDSFAQAVEFVANTLSNRLFDERVEKIGEDSCEMLNFYVQNM